MKSRSLTPFQWGAWLAMSAAFALFPLGLLLSNAPLREDLLDGRPAVFVLFALLWLPLVWAARRFVRQVDERDPWRSLGRRRAGAPRRGSEQGQGGPRP